MKKSQDRDSGCVKQQEQRDGLRSSERWRSRRPGRPYTLCAQLSNMPGRSSSLAMMAASCSWYCNSSAFNFCYYWIPSLEFQNRIHSVRFRFLEQNHNMIDIVQWVDGIEPITSAARICVFWLQDMWLDLLFLNHPVYRTGCGNPLLSLKLWLWLGGNHYPWNH